MSTSRSYYTIWHYVITNTNIKQFIIAFLLGLEIVKNRILRVNCFFRLNYKNMSAVLEFLRSVYYSNNYNMKVLVKHFKTIHFIF